MRRFKNPKLQVTFTKPAPEFVGDEQLPMRSVHTWLCTSNVQANNVIEKVMRQYDPFQRQTQDIRLDQVAQRLTDDKQAA
jgi:phage-related protein